MPFGVESVEDEEEEDEEVDMLDLSPMPFGVESVEDHHGIMRVYIAPRSVTNAFRR